VTTMHTKRRLTSGISALAVTVALCVAQPAYAQSEFANIEGHVEGAPVGSRVTAVDTATAGRVTSTFSTPRQMQLGLKFNF